MGDARRTYADVAARGNTTMTTDNVPFNYSGQGMVEKGKRKAHKPNVSTNSLEYLGTMMRKLGYLHNSRLMQGYSSTHATTLPTMMDYYDL